MDNLQVAYWAGLFDGEGCINIYRTKANSKSKTSRPSYTLQVSIDNTNEEVLKEIYETYGGTFYTRKRKNRTRIYCVKLCSNKAIPFLTDILPYLRIKKSEAIIALEFQEKGKRETFSPIPLTEKELAVRESYKLRLEQLKTRNNIEKED